MIHNFYAGPSVIDHSILNQVSDLILPKDDLLSIIEISHRSKRYGEIMDELYALTREILELNNDMEICFLQGGGRQQFYQIPFNFSEIFKTTYYIDTGTWANGAAKEASFFGNSKILASSSEQGYKYIPNWDTEPDDASYIYICTNNTIYGTEYHEMPHTTAPLIADMSSDLFSRKLDFNQFGLFYAATQKNAGTAGACLVVVNKNLFKKPKGSLPAMIDYRTHIDKQSLYNTPPVFANVMSLLTMRWIKEKGGLTYFENHNKAKAKILYDELNRNELFTPYAVQKDRSTMNAVFTGLNKDVEQRFLAAAEKENILGIKGHRSIGGFRASMYNALPKESVQVLVDLMQEFERKY